MLNFIFLYYSQLILYKFLLGENIADNGGIKLSYLAYEKHKQHTLNTDNNLRLPGLDYNNDQLFFIAFAYVSESFLINFQTKKKNFFFLNRVGVISKHPMQCIMI